MKLIHKLGLSLGAASVIAGSSVVILTTQSYAHANNIPEINRKGYDFSGINPYGLRDEVAHTAIKLDETRTGYHKHTYVASDFKDLFKDFKSYQGKNTPGVPEDPHYDTSIINYQPQIDNGDLVPTQGHAFGLQQYALQMTKSWVTKPSLPHQSAPPPPMSSGSLTGMVNGIPQNLLDAHLDDSARQQYNNKNIEMTADFRSIYDGPEKTTGIYDIAAKLANELVASKERRGNILAWNSSKHYERAFGSSNESDRGIVYSMGGPLPDIIDTSFHSGFSRYAPYGDVIIFNEAQYGYNIYGMFVYNPVTKQVVPNPQMINRYFPILRNHFNDLLWDDVRAGDIFTMAMGMAQSKVDADRLELLYDQEHAHYSKGMYNTGVSHGFTCVLDSLLFNKNVIDKYDGFLMEANSLRTRLPVGFDENGNRYLSANFNGGVIKREEMEKYFGTASIPLNNLVVTLRRGIKNEYGYLNRFNEILDSDPVFKAKILAKAHFKVNEGDPNIGHITPQELAFYKKHKLDFEVRNYGEGHGTKSTPREYMRIFNIQ